MAATAQAQLQVGTCALTAEPVMRHHAALLMRALAWTVAAACPFFCLAVFGICLSAGGAAIELRLQGR